MSSSPTVFIVDDDLAFLETTCRWLESVNYPVVAYESAEDFLKQFQSSQSGCLLLDILLPKMDGLKLLEEMNRRRWSIPTIAMTAHGKISDAVRAIKLGAVNYLEKPFKSKKALVELVRRTMESAEFAGQARLEMEEFGRKLSRLTLRQQEVLKLVVEGLSSSEIADSLGSTTSTVSSQRSAIMEKLSADSIPELVRLTLQYSVAMELDPALASIAAFGSAGNSGRSSKEKSSNARPANANSSKRPSPTGTTRKKRNSG